MQECSLNSGILRTPSESAVEQPNRYLSFIRYIACKTYLYIQQQQTVYCFTMSELRKFIMVTIQVPHPPSHMIFDSCIFLSTQIQKTKVLGVLGLLSIHQQVPTLVAAVSGKEFTLDETFDQENTIEFDPKAPRRLALTNYQILSKLYSSTLGGGWRTNGNWMVGDPCTDSWVGVTCADSIVTRLMLPMNTLRGTLPTEIGMLTGLTCCLTLHTNSLSGTIPSQVEAPLRFLPLFNHHSVSFYAPRQILLGYSTDNAFINMVSFFLLSSRLAD